MPSKPGTRPTLAILTILLTLPACALEMDEQADPSKADEAVAMMAPTLDNVQEHVFDRACATSGCHDSQTMSGSLNLSTADESFASLVDVPVANSIASENGWVLVKPGDPDLSFLVRKCGTPGLGEGSAMPVGGYQLHSYYQDLVFDWIIEGAKR